jgi:hypothetical protein
MFLKPIENGMVRRLGGGLGSFMEGTLIGMRGVRSFFSSSWNMLSIATLY